MKNLILFLFLFNSSVGISQKFSFIPEAGLLLTQIDGDKLQGYHKTGIMLGIGTHYELTNKLGLRIKTSFYKLGSARKDPFQDKLDDGLQLEMGLNTIGLELSAMYSPVGRSYFLGVGLVHHQILNFDYKIIDNIIKGPPRLIDPSIVASSFNNIKIFVGWKFATSFNFSIAYEKSLTDILKEDFFNIARLKPYHLGFIFSYKLNPVKKEKIKRKKTRQK